MARIIGLPIERVYLTTYFVGKAKHEQIANKMKEKYGLEKSNQGYDVASIDDQDIQFTTWILASKLLMTCRLNQVHTSMIAVEK